MASESADEIPNPSRSHRPPGRERTWYRANVAPGGAIELPDEVDRRVEAAIAQAEADLTQARINFRWGRRQLDTVKRAASKMGIPYQIYIKHVLYRQAIADLKADAEAAQG